MEWFELLPWPTQDVKTKIISNTVQFVKNIVNRFKFISYTYLKRKAKLSRENQKGFLQIQAQPLYSVIKMIKSVVDNLAESSVLFIMGAL